MNAKMMLLGIERVGEFRFFALDMVLCCHPL
jgi:hypothetical protein